MGYHNRPGEKSCQPYLMLVQGQWAVQNGIERDPESIMTRI